jgi:hypothetical protein
MKYIFQNLVKNIFILLLLSAHTFILGQNVGIGTNIPDNSAMLDVSASDKGFLMPRVTKANRPVNPADGLIIFQTDEIPGIYNYIQGEWRRIMDSDMEIDLYSYGPDTAVTFQFTGNVQTWVVPDGVYWVKINCKGAEGSLGVWHIPLVAIDYMPGGKGGESEGFLPVTPGETLYVNVGGFVTSPLNGTNDQLIQGGWNGGGSAKILVSGTQIFVGGAGGGASDVRQGGNTLAHRKIVAGGGGGGGSQAGRTGGAGGGISGGNPVCPNPSACGQGGTQTTGNAPGQGESPIVSGVGAGGGGWYGGTGAASDNGAGGGGSGFLDPSLRQAFTNSNIRAGHGIITITYNRNTRLDTVIQLPYPISLSSVNDALNTESFGHKAVLFSNNGTIQGDATQFVFDADNGRAGIGLNNPATKLEVKGHGGIRVSSTNPGSGVSDWIAASFGGLAGDKVVAGILNGKATIGAHNQALNNWDTLVINPGGKIVLPGLGESGKRFLTIDADNIVGDTSFFGFNNGLKLSGGNFQVGGHLNQSTSIASNGHTFSINYSFEGEGGIFEEFTPGGFGYSLTPIGQTFNFPYNYILKQIKFICGFPIVNGTFQIFQGQTISGTPLASGTLNVNPFGEVTIPLNNLNMAANTTYTLYLTDCYPQISLIGPDWPLGILLDLNGNPMPFGDLTSKFVGLPDIPGYHTLRVEGTTGKVGIGTPINTPLSSTLTVNGSNNMNSGSANWISANIGGQNGDRIVMGLLNGEPSIGAHNGPLTGWDTLNITPAGKLKIGHLAGNGNKFITVNNQGIVNAQDIEIASSGTTGLLTSTDWNTFNNKVSPATNVNTIAPISGGGTLHSSLTLSMPQANNTTSGFLSATDWNTFNNKQNSLPNASGTSNGILTSTDWNVFNNKQTALANASGSNDGILTAADWNIFNNKQNALANANGSTNGILTAADWNTYNNKYNLPVLTSGSILFSNGNNITENNSQLYFNSNTQMLGIGTSNPSAKVDIQGSGGLKVSSTNDGSGTTDWIAANAGGTSGDRVVMGVLNGSATIGAHNGALNAWDTLAVNPDAVGTSIVLGGNKSHTVPQVLNNTQIASSPVAVNGSIRQAYYSVPVSIPAGNTISFNWDHNLGYGPIVMMSTDQNGGGANMIDVSYTTVNNNQNQTVFVLKNNGSSTALGTFRWILVW